MQSMLAPWVLGLHMCTITPGYLCRTTISFLTSSTINSSVPSSLVSGLTYHCFCLLPCHGFKLCGMECLHRHTCCLLILDGLVIISNIWSRCCWAHCLYFWDSLLLLDLGLAWWHPTGVPTSHSCYFEVFVLFDYFDCLNVLSNESVQ